MGRLERFLFDRSAFRSFYVVARHSETYSTWSEPVTYMATNPADVERA